MIAESGLRWLLTVLFAALTAYGLWRVVRPTGHAGHGGNVAFASRMAHLLHALMALAMGVMVWPWGMGLPAAPQVVFFVLAAVWFPAAALVWGGSGRRRRAVWRALPHALVMAAMAWMLYAMATMGGIEGAGVGSGMADMPGMDMSGGAGAASMTLSDTAPRMAVYAPAVVLLVLALRWLARGFDAARSPEPGGPDAQQGDLAGEHSAFDVASHGVMALGMAVMLVAMA